MYKMPDYSSMTTEELKKELEEWRGAGAYSITGAIIQELRRRKKMKNQNKKASVDTEGINNQNTDIIVAGKTYKVKELNPIFTIQALMLVSTKEELYKYWQMAIETGIKRFRDNVDYVFQMRYPKYE